MTASNKLPRPNGISGFTLVELAIVLVIIGLIIGGVMAGGELIKQAHFRAEVSQYGRIQAATATFQLKYNALPGDFNRASTTIPGVGLNPPHTANGNGDGVIASLTPGSGTLDEFVYAWEHLSKAGFLDGRYDGVYVDGECQPTTCPRSKLFTGDVMYMGGASDLIGWAPSLYGHPLTNASIAIQYIIPSDFTKSSVPLSDTRALDAKIDDGFADKGRMLVMNDSLGSGSCVSGAVDYRTDLSVTYSTAAEANDCTIFYLIQ